MSTPTNPPAKHPPRERMPFHECYILIEVDDDGEEHASFYSSPAARDKATLDAIWFGGPDECHKEEAEQYLSELREKGFLAFEGDPPLRWRTLSDYMKQSESALAAAREEGRMAGRAEAIQQAKDRIREVQERRAGMKMPNPAAEHYHQEGMGQAWGLVHELDQYLEKRAAASRAGGGTK